MCTESGSAQHPLSKASVRNVELSSLNNTPTAYILHIFNTLRLILARKYC